jgi:hypothetical protein
MTLRFFYTFRGGGFGLVNGDYHTTTIRIWGEATMGDDSTAVLGALRIDDRKL